MAFEEVHTKAGDRTWQLVLYCRFDLKITRSDAVLYMDSTVVFIHLEINPNILKLMTSLNVLVLVTFWINLVG